MKTIFFFSSISQIYRQRIYQKILILFLGIIMAWTLWDRGTVQAKPYIPDADSTILEHLPSSANDEIRRLRALRMNLFQGPHNLENAIRVARQFVEIGRAEADPRYDGYAQSVLQPWWDNPTPPIEVLFIRAVLRQRRHHFEEALKDLHAVLDSQPYHAQAWLTQSVIHQVRGHFEAARRSCLPLIRLTGVSVSTACIANSTSLNGQAQSSYDKLLKVLSTTPPPHPSEKLWILTILGETAARLGDDLSAESHFQEALTLGIRDSYLLGTYSDWLLDQHRPTEVHALLKKELRADGLLLRVALAAKQLNSPQLPHYVDNLRARFEASRLRGDTRHLREEARFTLHLLKLPRLALQLAVKNWQVQREPWDARIVLEAAKAAGDLQAAKPIIEWLQHTRLEDRFIHRLVEQLS